MQRLQMAKWEIIPSVDLLVSVEIDHVRYLIHFGNTCIFWPIFRGSRVETWILNWRMPWRCYYPLQKYAVAVCS